MKVPPRYERRDSILYSLFFILYSLILMITRSDALALLKVLIAAAWADSRLSQAELNYIKAFAHRVGLSDTDWLELEPYLEDAPMEREVDELFRDLLHRLGTPGARNQVIRHLEEILNADAMMTAE